MICDETGIAHEFLNDSNCNIVTHTHTHTVKLSFGWKILVDKRRLDKPI